MSLTVIYVSPTSGNVTYSTPTSDNSLIVIVAPTSGNVTYSYIKHQWYVTYSYMSITPVVMSLWHTSGNVTYSMCITHHEYKTPLVMSLTVI